MFVTGNILVAECRSLSPLTIIFTTALLLFAADARTADEEGQYAIRGAGLISCALYTRERATQGDVYLVAAAWVDGYITGINQYSPQTYDLMSFESTELLMAVLDDHCKANPADPVFGALTNLFKKLWPDRLTGRSDKATIAIGEKEARHYVELIERVQKRLQAEGFYTGTISGEYSAKTLEAVKQFQESIGFDSTGFPDQLTLWRLLRNGQNVDG